MIKQYFITIINTTTILLLLLMMMFINLLAVHFEPRLGVITIT